MEGTKLIYIAQQSEDPREDPCEDPRSCCAFSSSQIQFVQRGLTVLDGKFLEIGKRQ